MLKMADAKICLVCAWRADCQKKFTISKNARFCPDFSKDLLLKEDAEDIQEKKSKDKKKGK